MSWVEKVVASKKKQNPGDLTSGKWRLFQTMFFWVISQIGETAMYSCGGWAFDQTTGERMGCFYR
jgi:hypothetical protein